MKKFNIRAILNIKQKSEQHGYAILFAVVVVSIISMIAIGLSNTTYKQLVLSSLASDSQLAFYQSDTATECALYMDNVVGVANIPMLSSWDCGKEHFDFSGAADTGQLYKFNSTNSSTTKPCFNFSINKVSPDPAFSTIILANGYNSCALSNPKTVERTIEVKY
jgi:hypothetical protein